MEVEAFLRTRLLAAPPSWPSEDVEINFKWFGDGLGMLRGLIREHVM